MPAVSNNKCRWLLPLLLLLSGLHIHAQLIPPAKWTYSLSDSTWQQGDTLELRFHTTIDAGWYLYASDFDTTVGPTPAEITFTSHPSYALIGGLQSPGRKEKYDSIWHGTYTYFTGKAFFAQPLHVSAVPLQVAGTLHYQLCSTTTGQCVRFEEAFDLQAFLGEPRQPTSPSLAKERGGLVGFFFLAFLAGIAALFTPCVFPLIPMTVTYFTKHVQNGRRSACLYGSFIVLIYTFIGFVLAPFMGPELANELATGWLPNILFFIIFLVFGFSFLGMFELILPHKWSTFLDAKSDKGGVLGIFFMALTLVLITFSCTGPIVGSILVQAAGGLQMKPVVGMLGYSLAFALPFSFFALFPKGLSLLPKSGNWLNTVKVTLGFIELAFALKFLSIADQTYHWHLLDREVYISLWIAIFSLLGCYLLGKLRLPKDTPEPSISVPRLIMALLVFSFVIYLVPGMFGAPLKALAGYLPPQATHDFDLQALYRRNTSSAKVQDAPCGEPLHNALLKFPHGLKGYFDYEQALACAQAQNKPLFIDFTGHGCVNCREMEARVWADPRILNRLRKDYILVALYIDDRTQLPENKWYTSAYDGKIKKTIGRKNADFQIRRFANNAQPYYVVLGKQADVLVAPRAYNLDIAGFATFLDMGKAAYAAKYRTKTNTLAFPAVAKPLF